MLTIGAAFLFLLISLFVSVADDESQIIDTEFKEESKDTEKQSARVHLRDICNIIRAETFLIIGLSW